MNVLIGIIVIGVFISLPQLYYRHVQQRQKEQLNTTDYQVKQTQSSHGEPVNVVLTQADGVDLAVYQYDVENPKGIVQIVHGAFEHAGRYDRLSRYLQQNGYVVVMFDHRGHGRSINQTYPAGFMRFPQETITDLAVVADYIKKQYPAVPFYMFGHSLGSIFARLYIQQYEEQLDKVILSGMVPPVSIASLGVLVGNVRTFYGGEYGYSYGFERLTVDYGDGKWVSYNTKNHEAVQKDPLMVRRFHVRTCVMLMQAMAQMANVKAYCMKRHDLPILMLSGVDDIITRGEKGLKATEANLRAAGYTNIENRVFDRMKHEIMHETDYPLVFEAILQFIEKE